MTRLVLVLAAAIGISLVQLQLFSGIPYPFNEVVYQHIKTAEGLCKDHGGVFAITGARHSRISEELAQAAGRWRDSYVMTLECADHLMLNPKFMVNPEGHEEFLNFHANDR